MKEFKNKQKIIKVSKVMRAILFAGLILWPFAGVVTFFTLCFTLSRHGPDLALSYFEGGFILAYIFIFIVNLGLFRFFGRLRNGCLFDAQTVRHLDSAGKWWIALCAIEAVYYFIGHEILRISNFWLFSDFFPGLVLIFVAWLLKEAQDLQEEQDLTV